MDIDFQLQSELVDARDRADQLARVGFDGAFTFEGPRDVFFPLVAAGSNPDLFFYTNVAIAFPRSPMHLAYAAYDLQRLTGGRFALGLGTQIRVHIENRFSSDFDRPVARMRELIAATRAIFRSWDEGVQLNFQGEFFQHTYLPPTFNPGPLPSGPPPIWCGAMGPKMTRMVASCADGLVLHPFSSEAYVDEVTRPLVEEALHESGRGLTDAKNAEAQGAGSGDATPPFSFVAAVIVAPYRNEEEQATACSAARFLLGFYGSTPAYRVVLDHHGWGDLQPELREMTKTGKWDELGSAYSDEQFDTLVISGSPKHVASELHRRFGGWATRVALSCPATLPDDLWQETLDAINSQ